MLAVEYLGDLSIPPPVAIYVYQKFLVPLFGHLLDWNWFVATVPERFEEELRGIVDGAEG